MTNKELCSTCIKYNECLFKKEVDTTIEKMPPLEKQTLIPAPKKNTVKVIPTEEAVLTHTKIEIFREVARDFDCPNVNYSPVYPGINTL